ncbi:hypothetical protein [Flavobacterium beibuense]|uniref:Uncharacterized protein n=1 Tax=Flavobacterium beibuense F44-8 TaxID=1406840 RepID=A0A0A2LTB7_9FLAO|nr:hypothetical protein [Flavobacterium beibuense]KGO83179.1 hypothetical protein Q763_03990 [Flavobacterium beibuense F44-8]
MSHLIIKEWKSLQEKILVRRNLINSLELSLALLGWALKFKKSNNEVICNLYADYFKYYERLNPHDYNFHKKWYDLDELLDTILGTNTNDYRRPIVIVRDILWEIIAFKTDILCENCGQDEYRLFESLQNSQDLVLCCDNCSHTIGLNNEFPQDIPNKYIPVKKNNLQLSKFNPSNFAD